MEIPVSKNISVSQLSINLEPEGLSLSYEDKIILKGTWFLPIIFKQTNWTVRKNKKSGTKIVIRITKNKTGYWSRVLMEEEGNIDINKCTAIKLRSIVKNSELNQIDFKTQRSSNLENYFDNTSTMASPI